MSNFTNETTLHSSNVDTNNPDESKNETMQVQVSFASPVVTNIIPNKKPPLKDTSTPLQENQTTLPVAQDKISIVTVRGAKDQLSNMYLNTIKVKGTRYKSVEH